MLLPNSEANALEVTLQRGVVEKDPLGEEEVMVESVTDTVRDPPPSVVLVGFRRVGLPMGVRVTAELLDLSLVLEPKSKVGDGVAV